MARWLTADDTDALAYIWPDAPTEEPAILALYLAAAKAACVAYAPTRDETGEVALGPVTLHRRNPVRDPRGTGLNPTFWVGHLGSMSNVFDFPGDVPTAVRWTRTDTGAARAVAIRVGVGMPGERQPVTVRLRVRGVLSAPLSISMRPNTGATNGASNIGSVQVTPEPQEIVVSGETFGGVSNASSGITLVSGAGQVGEWFEVTAIAIDSGRVSGAFFDGNSAAVTVGDRTYSHAWEGAENASSSVQTYRPFVFEPTIPDEWVLAQAMQARNIYNAGGAAGGPSSDPTAGGYGIATSYPLDWHVKQLLRPAQGMGAIL
ncbi:hypothetical protein ABC195_09430 [Microbacterium sp. 2P01SA-2]|uniref:hypothetical protein n=1 Tax=unclassified Microbacterium TaxID=2609290 RepID=UPI0039A28B73